DYLNVELAERHLAREETIERNGATYHISRWTDADHIFKRITLGDPSAPRDYVERVAKLTLEDFRFMFALCDMSVEQVFGDYRLEPFDVERSPRLIVIARKLGGAMRSASREILSDAAHGLGGHAEV